MAWTICKIATGHSSLENFKLDAENVWTTLHQLKDLFQDRLVMGEKAGFGLSTVGVDIWIDRARLTIGWDNWSGVFIMAHDADGDDIIKEIQTMMDSKELYCKLFINSELPAKRLFELINLHLKGTKTGIHTIRTDLLELDLRENREYRPDSQDFLFWRYYADIETQTGDSRSYISCVKDLMCYLIQKGICAVAACDFENELTEGEICSAAATIPHSPPPCPGE